MYPSTDDDSRVILLDENLYANQEATDYINAGYIDVSMAFITNEVFKKNYRQLKTF